jgi:hypothetical protein
MLRSVRTVAEGSGKAGGVGIATTNQYLDATFMNFGGHGSITLTSYNTVYTKRASALNLSDKVFDSTGNDISLTDAWIRTVGPNRVLRLEWTNYAGGNRTLNVWGSVEVKG